MAGYPKIDTLTSISPSHLEVFSHLSSLLKTQNLSFQFRNSNPKLQDGVKMHLLTRLGAMGVQENPGKTKWSLGGESVSRYMISIQDYWNP